MEDSKNRIPLQLSNGIITVPIRYELTHYILDNLRQDLLAFVDTHKQAYGVVFDLSGVKILDAHNFETLEKIIKAVGIMGLRVAICGMASGIVSSIVDMDINIKNIQTALNLNEAIILLQK